MNKLPHLLLVEDDRREFDALCALLRESGYQVTGCHDQSKALAILRQQRFDLLLCETERDGAAFVAEALAISPDLVAVSMIDGGGVHSVAAAMTVGVLDFILRPFEIKEVQPILTRALEIGRLRVENGDFVLKAAQEQARMQALTEQLDTLAGRIAHDLQAVLQVTEGFATVLHRSAVEKLDARENHYLERIVETSVRGNRLVNELMAYGRLGAQTIEPRPVDLTRVLSRAKASIEGETQGRAVEWAIGELPVVHGDAGLLEQVFVNLLSNALKYSRGREPARIGVQAHPVKAGVEIQVRDNGVGFDQHLAERLFLPLERLHKPQEFEGNGMGLASVRRIIERHGGTVRAETRPGEGALFAFTVPVASSRQAPHPAPPADTEERQFTLRVLLVDDDPMVLLSLRNMIETTGHHVEAAAGGQVGVEAFLRALRDGNAYDVVITDFGMPHMDGREVARLVKEAKPETCVIMLTGRGARIDAMDGWQPYVDHILGKPPRLAQVCQALESAAASVAC